MRAYVSDFGVLHTGWGSYDTAAVRTVTKRRDDSGVLMGASPLPVEIAAAVLIPVAAVVVLAHSSLFPKAVYMRIDMMGEPTHTSRMLRTHVTD